ncbi:MAG: transporter substrate-binding domain-containing protein [Rhabdaerophilum sp.]
MRRLGLLVLALLLSISIPVFSSAQDKQLPQRVLGAAMTAPWTGDLDGMVKRRVVRVLVPYSKTLFFIDRGRQLGVVAEFGSAFENWLNKQHTRGHLRLHVAFIPTPRDELFRALQDGKGDVVAANLTITPERLQLADFSDPWIREVREVVVTGPSSPNLATLDDLSGREVRIRLSSSYATHLRQLSDALVAKGRAPIKILAADEDLEDEDLLEMVQGGLLPFAIVDEHKAKAWTGVYPSLTLRSDLLLHSGGEIAWAMRKNSPQLKAAINAFFVEHGSGTSFGNTIRRRYFAGRNKVRNALADDDRNRFNGLWASFKTHGGAHDFDALMLAAQGYQESQLIQSRRSPRGAVGVMQLLPRTAAAPPVSLPDVASSADINILAGARYMRHLREVYVNDPQLDPRNRLLMTLAAYNAGPGNLRKFRREAQKMGLNPNIWFNNVEQAAAKIIGRETVQYVSNIYKYYLTYTILTEKFD